MSFRKPRLLLTLPLTAQFVLSQEKKDNSPKGEHPFTFGPEHTYVSAKIEDKTK